MRARWLGLAFMLCAACGDDAGVPNGAGGPDGGTPMGGNGGDGPSGGMGGAGGSATSSGGTVASGGTSDTGGGGGSPAGTGGSSMFDPAEHCAPGQYFEAGAIQADRAFGGLAITCAGEELAQGKANGIGEDARSILSILLPEPMQPGETTAISWELEVIGGDESSAQNEYWAATSECGSDGPLERFHANEAPKTGVDCGSLTPDIAYTHILRVVRLSPNPNARGGLTPRGVTVCTSGTCPGP
jgi:hypothetical protein